MDVVKEYVSRLEQACGEGREFVVILKSSRKDEALKRILSRCRVKRSLAGVMAICEYAGKEVSVFNIGKLVLKGVNGKEEAIKLLGELLSP